MGAKGLRRNRVIALMQGNRHSYAASPICRLRKRSCTAGAKKSVNVMPNKHMPIIAFPPEDFQKALLGWYDAARRDLPWRARPGCKPDPYRVWLSEIMLQQTGGQSRHSLFRRLPCQVARRRGAGRSAAGRCDGGLGGTRLLFEGAKPARLRESSSARRVPQNRGTAARASRDRCVHGGGDCGHRIRSSPPPRWTAMSSA